MKKLLILVVILFAINSFVFAADLEVMWTQLGSHENLKSYRLFTPVEGQNSWKGEKYAHMSIFEEIEGNPIKDFRVFKLSTKGILKYKKIHYKKRDLYFYLHDDIKE